MRNEEDRKRGVKRCGGAFSVNVEIIICFSPSKYSILDLLLQSREYKIDIIFVLYVYVMRRTKRSVKTSMNVMQQ